jgi:SAM-dependent methyltransferase
MENEEKYEEKEMEHESKIKEKIIRQWNNAGICSFDSSTYFTDPHIASRDNFIESRFLEKVLENKNEERKAKQNTLAIDIGAGLGRFTIILAQYMDFVYALEPANHIYHELTTNCMGLNNVKTFNIDFESFNVPGLYDVAIVSGLLYLYPDEMVYSFLEKLANRLKGGSMLIIRDFVIEGRIKKIPSSFITNGFCYYRDSRYWAEMTKNFGLTLSEIFQSRPSYKFEMFLRMFGLARIFNVNIVRNQLYKNLEQKRKNKILNFNSSENLTAFMVLKK